MSGIVGIVQTPGVPLAVDLLRSLTAALTFRGPDAQAVWCASNAGLGCTLLRTTWEAEQEQQPLTLDGVRFLVADARLDGRRELLGDLAAAGRPTSAHVSDAELLLCSFSVWGEDCVHHLRGDFAFAVWDTRAQSLFVARDHFGIKPVFYAPVADGLLFGNTLACLRQHPEISARLDERTIGDFLLFGYNVDPAATTFADVARLPAAHSLIWRNGVCRISRYWSLPLDSCIRYRRAADYVEQFRTLFQTAVADRLRTERVSVFMSGGLDSTAIAATAQQVTHDLPCHLHAYTVVFDHLFSDPERQFAGLAATALKIPVGYLPADGYAPYSVRGHSAPLAPEPNDDPTPALSTDLFQRAAGHARVVLGGEGGDPLLYSSPAYLMGLLQSGRWGTWLGECARYTFTRRRLPPLGLRSWLRRRLGGEPPPPPFPAWLDDTFARQWNLRDRWQEFYVCKPLSQTSHSEAYNLLSSSLWTCYFERRDPGCTACPLEVRYPFFDVRLVEFVLAIPVLPWCVDKELVRTIMCGILPEKVRKRPKTPLSADPMVAHLQAGTLRWAEHFDPVPELAAYVDTAQMHRLIHEVAAPEAWWDSLLIRPIALNYWLRAQQLFHERDTLELTDEQTLGNAPQIAVL